MALITIDNNNIIRGVTNLSKGNSGIYNFSCAQGQEMNNYLVQSSAQHLLQLPSVPVPEFD